MKLAQIVVIVVGCLLASACSDWIYRIDVPQGNFLDQKDVDKLRVEMTKEQVIFVLGNPVVGDSFDNDKWYYVYSMKRGMSKRGADVKKELVIEFEAGKLKSISGDYEEPEDFNVPLDA